MFLKGAIQTLLRTLSRAMQTSLGTLSKDIVSGTKKMLKIAICAGFEENHQNISFFLLVFMLYMTTFEIFSSSLS